jgi:hypothetical protein
MRPRGTMHLEDCRRSSRAQPEVRACARWNSWSPPCSIRQGETAIGWPQRTTSPCLSAEVGLRVPSESSAYRCLPSSCGGVGVTACEHRDTQGERWQRAGAFTRETQGYSYARHGEAWMPPRSAVGAREGCLPEMCTPARIPGSSAAPVRRRRRSVGQLHRRANGAPGWSRPNEVVINSSDDRHIGRARPGPSRRTRGRGTEA